ncbi:MAG: alpha/beta hydrolase [Pirellulaceae bacterium]
MNPVYFAVALLAGCFVSPLCNAQSVETIRIWPDQAPGETKSIGPERIMPSKDEKPRPIIRLTDVSEPMLTVYPAANPASTGTAVIVCPGGGYNILAYNHEGTEICEWLNSIGVTAFLLKYRVPRRDPETPHELPLQDAQRAVRLVRSRAEKWSVDPERIGMLGFSAGGHLTVMAGTHAETETYPPVDVADQVDARPNFLIPIYPVYLVDKSDATKLDPLVKVDAKTPPTFTAITYDDADRAIGAALLFIALKQNKVPAELHIYHKEGTATACVRRRIPLSLGLNDVANGWYRWVTSRKMEETFGCAEPRICPVKKQMLS